MTLTPVVGPDVVRVIVEQVWESLLRTPAVAWSGPETHRPDAELTAEVALTGDWNGIVRLSCDPGTAQQIARAMFAARADQLPEEDVHDAFGEVVNVIGGNVKGSLEGSTSLGLPVVARRPPCTDAAGSRCVVEWRGAPVVVEVCHLVPTPAPAASAPATQGWTTP
jgi:chemotaxis protein CheX